MKTLIFVIVILAVFSCSSSDDDNCCKNIDVDLTVSVTNGNGNDLLDPLNGSIDVSDFKLYFLSESGERILFNRPNLDSPKGFSLITPEESGLRLYGINLVLNTDYIVDDTSTTFISWNDVKFYEIKSYFSNTENSLIVTRIMVDDIIAVAPGEERYFTIIE
jgi:hypothetical protein